MKKLLSILASTSLISTSAVSVVACGTDTDSIGLLISNFNNAYFQNMMAAGKSYAETKGYTLNTYDSKADVSGANDQANVQSSMTKGDQAIIINPANVTNNKAIVPALDANIPVINIDTEYASTIDERGAAGFVSEQTNASDKMFDEVYKEIYGELPSEENKNQKVKVYAMWSNQDNDAEQKRFQGFVLNNMDWIEIINHPGEGFHQGSVATGNENTGDAAGDVLTSEWSGGSSAKNAHVIWAGNDPMALGMKKAIDLNPDMQEWFYSTDTEGKQQGFIVGFDGSEDVASDISKWTEEERNHIFITVKQEYQEIVEAAIDEAIKLIDLKAEGTNPPKNFEKSTEIDATVMLPPGKQK